jgi:hypothetical protein
MSAMDGMHHMMPSPDMTMDSSFDGVYANATFSIEGLMKLLNWTAAEKSSWR